MTRFAGMGPNRRGLELSDFRIQNSGASAGQASGAGKKVADIYSSIAANAPRADEAAIIQLQERAKQKAGVMAADQSVYTADKLAEAQIEAAQLQADAAKAAADASASGNMAGSIIGGIASIGGAFLSDSSTKHNIEPLEDALTTLRNLKPVTFYYNEEYSTSPERLHHGFIAQEYKEVLPDATYYDESIGKLAIDTGDLIAILVSAVQTLESRVTRMEAENALKGAVR